MTGSEINSTDLVGNGNVDRLAVSSEIVKDDGVPSSSIYRQAVRKDNEVPEVGPDSGELNVSEFGNPDSNVGGYGGSSLDAIERAKKRANGNKSSYAFSGKVKGGLKTGHPAQVPGNNGG